MRVRGLEDFGFFGCAQNDREAGARDDRVCLLGGFVGYYGEEGVARRAGVGVYKPAADIAKVTGLLEVGSDQVEATAVGGIAPDTDGLGGEHAVGEGGDEDAAGLEDAVHVPENLDRPDDVLDGHGDNHGVKGVVLVGQDGILVDVLDKVVVEVGVVLHFQGVHTETGEALAGMAGGPMGTPTAHQVQHHGIGGYQAAEDVAHGGDGRVVDMDDQAGLNIEIAVVAFVLAAEELGGEGGELGKR